MIKNLRNQTGSAQIILVTVIVLALLGALGFIFWQNFIQSKYSAQFSKSASSTTSTQRTNVKAPADPNIGYLVLADWGIKFKLPDNSSEVRAYKETISNQYGNSEVYRLTTKRVEELGHQCVPDATGYVIRLSSISRSETKLEHYSSAFPANNNEPINGYYYYVSGGQSTCSDEHTDWQSADDVMTSDLLSKPLAVE